MTTLLVIDLQQEFSRRIAAGRDCSDPGALAQAAAVLAQARKAGIAVVHVHHDDPRPESGFRRDKPTGAPIAATAPLPGEAVVVKTTSSAFAAPGLLPALAGDRDLVVIGAALNYCVSSTLRSAADLGLRARLVADACFCFDATAPDGTALPARMVRDVTLAGLGDFAEIVAAADLRL